MTGALVLGLFCLGVPFVGIGLGLVLSFKGKNRRAGLDSKHPTHTVVREPDPGSGGMGRFSGDGMP